MASAGARRGVAGACLASLAPSSSAGHPHCGTCAGISLSAFYPCLRHWLDRMKARPAVQRGLNVPDPNMVLGHTGGLSSSAASSSAVLSCERTASPCLGTLAASAAASTTRQPPAAIQPWRAAPTPWQHSGAVHCLPACLQSGGGTTCSVPARGWRASSHSQSQRSKACTRGEPAACSGAALRGAARRHQPRHFFAAGALFH
jgi:hypothetical protein